MKINSKCSYLVNKVCWKSLSRLLSFYSQCAMAALNDVRQYLSVEGGQVAVSSWHCPWGLYDKTQQTNMCQGCIRSVFSCCFRSLMPQIQQEKEEEPSSSSLSRMVSRYDKQVRVFIEFSQSSWLYDLSVHYIVLSTQVFFVESVCEDPDVIAQNIVVRIVSFQSSINH